MTLRVAIKTRRFQAPFAAAAALLLLAACGSNGSSSDEVGSGAPAAETTSLAYKDTSDTVTTSVSLTASGERDAESGAARLYVMLKDQDGTALLFLNKHNFTVLIDPRTAPSTVPPANVTLTTATSSDRVVALVIDSSGSMSATDPTSGLTRLQAAQAAAKLYVENMVPGDYAAVVTFSDSAQIVQALTDDKALLNAAVDSLTPTGATNTGAAVSKAVEAVGSRPGKRAMILLTDGDDTVDSVTGGPPLWRGNANSTRNQGLVAAQESDFRIYSVGLGTDLSDVGLADLNTYASETGGTYYAAPTTAALITPFSQTIPNEIADLPPMETYVLEFPNPYAPRAGQTLSVHYGVSVSYETGNGTLTDYFAGTYRVP
ncbi:MAG: VWA domain-containing protein [Deltaproteobacteria bacterium]|nr:VWA domain-containing protein [Deltaproteobacteria bacterium]